MMEIYKELLNLTGETTFTERIGEILSVQIQRGSPVVYYTRSNDFDNKTVTIYGYETGREIDFGNYIGTLLFYGDNYVIHYFYAFR